MRMVLRYRLTPALPAVLMLLLLPQLHAQVFSAECVETFSSPENSLPALLSFIDSASESLYINVYTFTSSTVASAVAEKARQGVDVKIIVERTPVGGMPAGEMQLLRALKAAGAEVYLYSGSLRYNHAKYAIADGSRVLVSTENFGEHGFPADAKGNRGWGVVVHSRELAAYLLEVFMGDLRQSRRLEEGLEFYNFQQVPELEGSWKVYCMQGLEVVPVVAPENAVDVITELLDSANTSIYVQQFYIYPYWGSSRRGSPGNPPNPLLEAAIAAARRGVEVRILLDSYWYNTKEDNPRSNLRTATYVNGIAKEEGLSLEARLALPYEDGRIRLYHTKGVVVDGRAVLVSSVNWNENSPTRNREVGVVVYSPTPGESLASLRLGEAVRLMRGDTPAAYFQRVFEEDWQNSGGELEKGRWRWVAVVVVVLSGAAGLLLRRGWRWR
ncbi:MAG: hypothetical protein GXN98_03260 [Euryarchaeota archaeon]|nr:hypothetical protein [Euryarchaeota archaeon]